jgi:hypothetical protein
MACLQDGCAAGMLFCWLLCRWQQSCTVSSSEPSADTLSCDSHVADPVIRYCGPTVFNTSAEEAAVSATRTVLWVSCSKSSSAPNRTICVQVLLIRNPVIT